MIRNCYEGCIHYGTQFEIKEEAREERREGNELRFSPLYMRMRRHSMRRGFPY